jgi:hypothetical protein
MGATDVQTWNVEFLGSLVRFRNGLTNLCLEADRGTVFLSRPCSSSALGQQWTLPVLNSWTQIQNRLGGYLGAIGSGVQTSSAEGTNRQLWEFRNTPGQ